MRRLSIPALIVLALVSNVALAMPVEATLVSHDQRSSAGTLRSLVWEDCGAAPQLPPCLYPGNAWVIANGVMPSTATWTWDSSTGVLAGTGLFWTTIFINSSPNGQAVISDKVVDLRIDTVNDVTSAASYECVEGNFLASVGANGCKGTNLGPGMMDDSVAAWNVGGNARCVTLAIGGNDFSMLDGSVGVPGTPFPRGLTAQAAGQAGAGCAGTSAAFDLWTVVQDSGGTLILSNGICIGTQPIDATCAGVNYLTFSTVPAPAAAWLLGTALGWVSVRARFRRRPPP